MPATLPGCSVEIPCYTARSRLPALVRRSELQERAMSDSSKPDPSKLDPSKPDPFKADPSKPDPHKSESGFQYSITNLRPAEPVQKITITFPDGASREYPQNTTGLDIAKGISPSLAKRTVAMALNGDLADLNDPIMADARIELISRDDPQALELIRHDCAHVLAEAVQSLWPGTQVTIGP